MRIGKLIAVAIILLILTIQITGCASVSGDWEKASVINDISSYNTFLEKYPESEFTKIANARVDSLIEIADWNKAVLADTHEAYYRFLRKYSSSKQASEPRGSIIVSVSKGKEIDKETDVHSLVDIFKRELEKDGFALRQEGEASSSYHVIVEAGFGNVGTIALSVDDHGDVGGFSTGTQEALSIDYYLHDPDGKQLLIDPDGTDYSKYGITHGEIPPDSRFFVSFSVTWDGGLRSPMERAPSSIAYNISSLLAPSLVAHYYSSQ